MKIILKLFIVIIVLFCFVTEGAKSFKPNGDPVKITLHQKSDHSLGVQNATPWKGEFLEETFYRPFDYFKVWIKTENSGDIHENGVSGSGGAEYPISNSLFDDPPFSDASGLQWTILTKSETMFEAYAPFDLNTWPNAGPDFYFWLYLKTIDDSKPLGVTMYFEAFDTRTNPGTKQLVNFCAINYDGGWHCNNFDRPVNVYINPSDPGNTGYHLGLIQQWYSVDKIPDPNTQLSYWPFEECGSAGIDGLITYDMGNGLHHYNGELVSTARKPGFLNMGIELNGEGYVNIGNIQDFNFDWNNPFTVAGWVNFHPWSTPEGGFGDIISKMKPPGDGYRGWGLGAGDIGNGTGSCIRFDLNDWWQNNAIYLDVYGNTNTYWYDNVSKTQQTTINPKGWGDDNWHFIVASYTAVNKIANGTPSEKDLTVYIDGALAGCHRNPGTPLYQMTNDANLRFGYRNSSDKNRGYQGKLDEVYIFNKALSPLDQAALYASYFTDDMLQHDGRHGHDCSYTQAITPLVLSLEAKFAEHNGVTISGGPNEPNVDGTPVDKIPDKAVTNPNDDNEDALMPLVDRQPAYYKNVFGSDNPGIKFTYDYGALNYGKSDIMYTKYHSEITTDNAHDMYNPDNTPKTLIILFKVGNSNNHGYGDPAPYYSDGRQTIYEAGGPLSGFNVYISNGYLCFGMWNRFESQFIKYGGSPVKPDFYPMDADQIYMACLEFDGTQFRASVSKATTDPDPAGQGSYPGSGWYNFSGLTYDNTDGGSADLSGVGGAHRTAYYDYNTGETYSDHFGGYIGGIWLYNTVMDKDYLDQLFALKAQDIGSDYKLIPPFNDKISEGWELMGKTAITDGNILSSAYPNPFTTTTSFGINLPEKQNIIIELYNDQCSKVQTIYAGELSKGLHDFKINGNELSSGLYLFKVTGDNFVQTGKVILSK